MTMKKVNVTAQAFDRKTGEIVGQSRVEPITIAVNRLFQKCNTILDIKNAYEAFWNELNKQSEAVVFVQRIEIVE